MRESRLIRREERASLGNTINYDEDDDGFNDDETDNEEYSDWGDSNFTDSNMYKVAEESLIKNSKLLETSEIPSLEDCPIPRKLSRFAEWAFGARRIPSLDILAYGDFSYNERFKDRNEILCRNTLGSAYQERKTDSNFRRMRLKEREDFIREHVEFLGACPVDFLLDD